jgi:cytoplasmic iron level regulating protein YaaA (DUF328/UPF0246 family)
MQLTLAKYQNLSMYKGYSYEMLRVHHRFKDGYQVNIYDHIGILIKSFGVHHTFKPHCRVPEIVDWEILHICRD